MIAHVIFIQKGPFISFYPYLCTGLGGIRHREQIYYALADKNFISLITNYQTNQLYMRKHLFLLLLVAVLPVMAQGPTEFNVNLKGNFALRVTVCADSIFRVQLAPQGKFTENLMLRYGVQKSDWPSVKCQKSDKGGTFAVSTGRYTLTVNKRDGSLQLTDKSGKTVVERITYVPGSDPLTAALGKEINEKFASLRVAQNDGNGGAIIGDMNADKLSRDTAETGDFRHCSILNFSLAQGERFYGGGSTSREHIQHRGELLRMWTTYQHTEIPQPMMVSSRGWGVFNNTTCKHFFDIGRHDKDVMSIYNTSGEADFYLMAGRDMGSVISAYTLITGRSYLLPKWAYGLCFGPHMREDQFDILRDAVNFRQMGVPCDLLWLEPQWMAKYYDFSTKKRWDYDHFSAEPYWDADNPNKSEHHSMFLGRLKALGFKVGLWLCADYDLSVPEEDALAHAIGKPESGQEHWMDHLMKFVDNGVRGFKLDPSNTINEHPDFKYYNGQTDKVMHNLNQILLPKQLEVTMRQHTGRRSWHHYTAGWAGTQHWGASTSGDNGGGRTALFDQINLGMSGFMNTSCDVLMVGEPQEMQSLHFGMFLPWIQINSWYSLYHPYWYTKEQQEVYKAYIQLRYRLLPYVYSAALEGALTGMPIVRSMPLMFPDDRQLDDKWDQYMFGHNLLVGIFTDEIYLPRGEWTDFWTGERVEGGRMVKRTIPKGRSGLLFARQGAIIPMQPDMNYVGERPIDTLIVKVFPKGQSSYTLLEDQGETYDYERGAVARTTFQCSEQGGRTTFSVLPVEGRYDGMYTSRTYQLEVYTPHKPSAVSVNDTPTSDFQYGQDGILRVTLPQRDVNQKATVTLQ